MASTTIIGRTDMTGAAGLRLLVAAALALMSIPLLSGPSLAAPFTNPQPIVVPASGPPDGCPTFPGPNNSCPPAAAVPYPSTITLAGFTGAITDVNVTLNGLTYNSPADLDVMVEAPDGQRVMLMSDDCGVAAGDNPVAGINLTFDDAAPTPIPADTACASGTFQPSDDDDDPVFQFTMDENFPTPAPAPPVSTLPMSTLNASSPNGDWNLWVVDDNPGPQNDVTSPGQIAGGWTLDIIGPTGGSQVTTTTTTTTSTSTTTSTTAPGATTTTTAPGATTTTTAPGATTTSTTVAGAATTTTVAGAGTTNTTASSTAPILRLSSNSVPAGQRVTVAGDRLPANTGLQVNFLSAPVVLGNVTTNATGSFQTVFTIPADATAGTHQINVSNAAGTVLASADLTVTRTTSVPGSLARTGLDTRRLAGVALLAVAMGILVLFSPEASRRRSHWKRRINRRRLSGALTWK